MTAKEFLEQQGFDPDCRITYVDGDETGSWQGEYEVFELLEEYAKQLIFCQKCGCNCKCI